MGRFAGLHLHKDAFDELNGLAETIGRLGDAKTQEALPRFAEAFTAQARDAESIIGGLKQVHR